MNTYSLKSTIRRGGLLSAAFALVLATVVPVASTYAANELNPLTDRSLTLTSGSPGWAFTDGSGNATYSPPNSGANGQKTGNTFSFKVSSDTTADGVEPIRAFTFQYCTTSAGDCLAPGDNGWTGAAGSSVRTDNSAATIAAKTSDLEVVTASPSELSAGQFAAQINATSGAVTAVTPRATTGGNFVVYKKDGANWVQSTGWTMTSEEAQYGDEADRESTGARNQIKLVNDEGEGFTSAQEVKVVFFGTDTNYITNPGKDEFFVKINTYNSDTTQDASTLVDGGVTVANVMNESIQITTKVLETMDFSVGTVDPFTLAADKTTGSQLYAATGQTTHRPCEPIVKGMTANGPQNTLQMGNALGEFSLETERTYSTHSYWRLSSNSSAGATVYYSGVTLSNTVGDKIDAIGAEADEPKLGSEQFGLAIANGDGSDVNAGNGIGHAVDYTVERAVDGDNSGGRNLENGADNATNGIHASVTDAAISNLSANASYHAPQLYPLAPTAEYGNGAGVVNAGYAAEGTTKNTSFAFDESSNTIPVAMATQDTQVVDCVTAKVRYIANIAATTPAGIYTTKINYIAAPQY